VPINFKLNWNIGKHSWSFHQLISAGKVDLLKWETQNWLLAVTVLTSIPITISSRISEYSATVCMWHDRDSLCNMIQSSWNCYRHRQPSESFHLAQCVARQVEAVTWWHDSMAASISCVKFLPRSSCGFNYPTRFRVPYNEDRGVLFYKEQSSRV